jgi:hypothetical protein
MSAPTPTRLTGRALGEAIVEIVTAHPERHRQAVVVGQKLDDDYGDTCGTQACIAGWACALHLGVPVDDDEALVDTFSSTVRWDDRLEESAGSRDEDVAAFKLLFGEDAYDDDEDVNPLFQRFTNRVFANMSEAGAIENLVAMLDEHYGATA